MIKLFKKPTKLYFLSLFQQVWTLIFMGLGFMLNICFRRSCCQPDRKITRQTKTDTSQNHHTTGVVVVSEEAVFTQTCALLSPPLIFGRILKRFDPTV